MTYRFKDLPLVLPKDLAKLPEKFFQNLINEIIIDEKVIKLSINEDKEKEI